jgi:WD40 repeat protein
MSAVQQFECPSLVHLVSRIGAAPAGISLNAGTCLSVNRRYVAYSGHLTLFVFSLPDFSLVASVAIQQGSVRAARLSPTRFTEIAFTTTRSEFVYYDFVKRVELGRCDFSEKLWSAHCSKIEFNSSGTIAYLYGEGDDGWGVEIDIPGFTHRNKALGGYNEARFCLPHPNLQDVILLVDEDGDLIIGRGTVFDENCRPLKSIECLTYDPLNDMHCAAVGSGPTWAIFSFMPTYTLISKAGRDDIVAKAGDWIIGMPGNFVTGSAKVGVLHVWTVASGQVNSTIELERAGVFALLRVADTRVVVGFMDGNIGMVDCLKKEYIYKLNAAHQNTIFSTCILPADPGILATAGADGRMCLWSLPKLEKITNFRVCNDGLLLTSCLSPGGGYLGTSSSTGWITVVSMKTKAILFQEKMHEERTDAIAWSPHNADIIACTGSDCKCLLYDIKQHKVIATIFVKAQLRRLQFSPHENSLAIACADGSVYVRLDGGAYLVIKGHGEPLFDLAWSPYDKTLLAATDDKGGLTVFNVVKQTWNRGVGHDCARPVVWSCAVPNVLITGGYDGRIVFWDLTRLTIIGDIRAHCSHIYGLSVHPDRPFLLVSTSRDETIRVWNYASLLPTAKVKYLLANQKVMSERVDPYEGAKDLTKLVHRITRDGVKLSFHDGEICHVNDVIRLARQRIDKMTSSTPKDQSTLLRAKKSRQTVIDAAELSLKSGDVKRYCELMFLAGEHDLALSAAPAVSYNFWQALMLARAQMQRGTQEAADLMLLAGKPREAISTMLDMRKFESAMLIAASLRDTEFVPRTKSVFNRTPPPQELPFIQTEFNRPDDFQTYSVASKRALRFAREGKPLLSAASLLSVGDVIGAAWRLLHCGELVWAVEINRCLEDQDEQINLVFQQYCLCNGVEGCYASFVPRVRRKLIGLVVFTNDEARDAFYKNYEMKTVAEFDLEAKKARGIARVQFLILAGKSLEAAVFAAQNLKALICDKDAFDFCEAFRFLESVHYIRFTNCKEMRTVVALSYYLGVYQALWRGYDSIIEKLVESCERIIIQDGIEWLKPKLREMKIVACLTLSKRDVAYGKYYSRNVLGQSQAMEGLQKLPDGPGWEGGSTVQTRGTGVVPIDVGCTLYTSFCSGKEVHGNICLLEDGKTAMSSEEAVMWHDVTPFSPLETHGTMVVY